MSWVEHKLGDVPESLRERIVEAVAGGRAEGRKGGRTADQLRRIGEELMHEAKSDPSTHDTAMKLLAADALITFACEAVAEQQPEKLAELW